MADYSMANRKIAYTLGRGRAYIFDMSSTSGYMGEKYVQEFGPIFFLTCPQLVGTWVKNIFRNLVPDFLTRPQLVGTWVKNIFRNLVPDFLAYTPWRIPPYEKYPRKGVLARGHKHI